MNENDALVRKEPTYIAQICITCAYLLALLVRRAAERERPVAQSAVVLHRPRVY